MQLHKLITEILISLPWYKIWEVNVYAIWLYSLCQIFLREHLWKLSMLLVYLFLHSLVFSFHHILINFYLYANYVQVYGALRMSVKMFLMWNSQLLVDGGGDAAVATSLLEASNLLVLRVLFWHVVFIDFIDIHSCSEFVVFLMPGVVLYSLQL